MTKKEQTIKACKELRKKYLNPQGRFFMDSNDCALCKIYNSVSFSCYGCPLSTESFTNFGCTCFKTAKAVSRLASTKDDNPYKRKTPNKAFIARADFFKKIIPILRKIPARRFTPSGWTYFKELDRNW